MFTESLDVHKSSPSFGLEIEYLNSVVTIVLLQFTGKAEFKKDMLVIYITNMSFLNSAFPMNWDNLGQSSQFAATLIVLTQSIPS